MIVQYGRALDFQRNFRKSVAAPMQMRRPNLMRLALYKLFSFGIILDQGGKIIPKN